MKFNVLNKNKNQEKLSTLDRVDKKYCCEDIINHIERDLSQKLDIDTVSPQEDKSIIITVRNWKNNKYIIVVHSPTLACSGICTYIYEIKATIDDGNGKYIDYIFNATKYEEDKSKDDYRFSLSYSYTRYVNGNVAILLDNISLDGNIDYVVVKDSLKLEIKTKNTNWRIDAILQKLTNFDLIEIYNSMKELDKNLVVDLSIRITNEELKSVEELSIYNGNITNYRKKYYDNDILVSIDYRDGKLVKNTELIVDDIDNQKITDFDVNESIVKVKRLSK